MERLPTTHVRSPWRCRVSCTTHVSSLVHIWSSPIHCPKSRTPRRSRFVQTSHEPHSERSLRWSVDTRRWIPSRTSTCWHHRTTREPKWSNNKDLLSSTQTRSFHLRTNRKRRNGNFITDLTRRKHNESTKTTCTTSSLHTIQKWRTKINCLSFDELKTNWKLKKNKEMTTKDMSFWLMLLEVPTWNSTKNYSILHVLRNWENVRQRNSCCPSCYGRKFVFVLSIQWSRSPTSSSWSHDSQTVRGNLIFSYRRNLLKQEFNPWTEYGIYIFQTIQISTSVKDDQKFFTPQNGWFLKTLTPT